MKSCIVVDDSSVIRKVARRILESHGFTILEAENGETALALCREEMPDTLLVDASMPVMDGCEFLKEVRRLPGGDAPQALFCLTEHDVAQIARGLRAGANDCLMKPFDRELMTAKLQEAGWI